MSSGATIAASNTGLVVKLTAPAASSAQAHQAHGWVRLVAERVDSFWTAVGVASGVSSTRALRATNLLMCFENGG
jgi:hypothetical protein